MRLWIFMIVQFLLSNPLVLGLYFKGLDNTFAEFSAWNGETTGTLTFQFRSRESNQTILYVDDGGFTDFLEVVERNGYLKLRISMGPLRSQVTVNGVRVNDMKWHFVQIVRHYKTTSIEVDLRFKKTIYLGRKDPNTSAHLRMASSVFFGGVPSNVDFNSFTLPTVMYGKPFKGNIRNIFCRDRPHFQKNNEIEHNGSCTVPLDGWLRPLHLIYFDGISFDEFDSCSRPMVKCVAHGVCFTNEKGISYCNTSPNDRKDCRNDSTVTFTGEQYLMYTWNNSKQNTLSSTADDIVIEFKTAFPSGLLMHAGPLHLSRSSRGYDYAHLAVRDGAVVYHVNLGGGRFHCTVRPHSGTFSDNQWHILHVQRTAQRVNITIDGIYSNSSVIKGKYTRLDINGSIVVGGNHVENLFKKTATQSPNFVGCLRNVKYSNDNDEITFKRGSSDPKMKEIGSWGRAKNCKIVDPGAAIGFVTGTAYLELQHWDVKNSVSPSIEFKFRTKEPHGVILYNVGSQTDFFAVELYYRLLWVMLQIGTKTVKVLAATNETMVNDGQWHKLKIILRGRIMSVSFDGVERKVDTKTKSNIRLKKPLYLGGVESPGATHQLTLPSQMWAGMLGYNYVGCISELLLNGSPVNLTEKIEEQISRASGTIEYGCYKKADRYCAKDSCGLGLCYEGWNRFICNCENTGYIGGRCEKNAVTFQFNGSQSVKISLPSPSTTQSEEIRIRFKTLSPNATLFVTSNEKNEDGLHLSIVNSTLRLNIKIGENDRLVSIASRNVSNGVWHNTRIIRQVKQLFFWDDLDQQTVVALIGTEPSLEVKYIEIGLSSKYPGKGFKGKMQQMKFNNREYLTDHISPSENKYIKSTATILHEPSVVIGTVSFRKPESFVKHPFNVTNRLIRLELSLKTEERSGLLLYRESDGDSDAFALEIVDGQVYFTFQHKTVKYLVQLKKSDLPRPINNVVWQQIRVDCTWQFNRVMVRLEVGNYSNTKTFDLKESGDTLGENPGRLYVGGVESRMYALPSRIFKTTMGYVGCLAQLEINGISFNLTRQSLKKNGFIVEGCRSAKEECIPNPCNNGGICDNRPGGYVCGCDYTSFSGPTCSSKSSSSEFMSGLMRFPLTDQTQDEQKIAFRFKTRTKNAATIMKVVGKNRESLTVGLNETGYLVAEYRFELMKQKPVMLSSHKPVNDAKTYRVVFTRKKNQGRMHTSVLEVNHMTVNYSERSYMRFDTPVMLMLGGETKNIYFNENDKIKIEKPFYGVIYGFVYNDYKILVKANEQYTKVVKTGTINVMFVEEYVPESSKEILHPQDCSAKMYRPDCLPEYGKSSTNNDIFLPVTPLITTTEAPEEQYIPFEKNPIPCENCKPNIDKPYPPTQNDEGGDYTLPRDKINNPYDSPIKEFRPEDLGHITTQGIRMSMTTTGVIIGIVSSLVVAVLILIYAVYKYQNRSSEGIYKADDSNSYQMTSTPTSAGAKVQLKTTTTTGNKVKTKPITNKHELKEWYV